MTEAGRQVPPGDARAHQVHDPVQEAPEIAGMADADPGIPAQVATHGLEFDVAQRVAGHGRESVKWANRIAMIIRRS